jgi:hypothetical protein
MKSRIKTTEQSTPQQTNGTTAVMALDKALTKIVPKPSKRDVIKAAAKALFDERTAEWMKQKKAVDEANEAAEKAVRALVKVSDGCVIHDVQCHRWSNGYYEVTVKVPQGHPAVAALHQKSVDAERALPCAPQFDGIYHTLQQQAQQRAPGVDQLLSDPAIKAKLASMAKELLAKPTSADRATAITV